MESSAAVLPLLAEYLILNAPILIEPFHDVRLAISSSVSNDSGLSDVDGAPEPSMSPDSSALASPASGCSFHVSPLPVTSEQSSRRGYVRCKKHYSLRAPSSAYYVSSLSTDDDDDEEDDEDDLSTEIERDDDNDEDRTPVLSRENSNVQNRPTHIAAWRSASKERYIICDSERDSDKRRHELIGGITVASSTIRRRETVGGFCASPSPQLGSAQPRTQVPADSIPSISNNVSKNHRPLGIASSMRNGSPLTVRRQFLPTTETAASDAESNRVGLTNLVMVSRNELTRSSPAIVRRDQEAGSSGGILTSTTPTDLSNGSRLVQQRKTALPMTEGSPRILRKSSTLSTSSSLHSSNSCFASPLPPRRKNSGGLMSNDRRDDDAQIANTATGAKISTSASEMRKSFSFDNKETALRVAKSESSVEMPQISSAPTPYSSYRQEAAASNHRWALKKQFSEGACNMRTNVKATSAASDTDAIISRNHHRNLQETDTQRSRCTPPLTNSNVGKSSDRFRSQEKFWASRTVAQTRCTNNNNKTNKNSNHNTNSITLNEMNTTTTATGPAVIPSSSSSRNNQSSQKNVVEAALPRMSPPPMQQRFFTSPLVDRKRVMEVQPHPKVAAHSNEKNITAQERRDSTPIGTRLVEVKPMVRESFAAKTPPPPLMYTSLITGGVTVADTNVAKLVSQKNAGLVEHVKPTSNQQQTHRDTSNGSNGNFARRERKKNRSILMEPLEVNWSVDELRSIFQSESAPPALDTEYRASTDSFSVR